jgi:hypothetical protein
MAPPDLDRPYLQKDVQNMLHERLPGGEYNWIRDPEGNPAVEAYGSRHLPAQPVYLNYRPSVVKLQIKFTPRRISPTREEELWQAADATRAPFKGTGITARRQKGNTQETERDEQWVVNVPERMTEAAYETLKGFVLRVADCLGLEAEAD